MHCNELYQGTDSVGRRSVASKCYVKSSFNALQGLAATSGTVHIAVAPAVAQRHAMKLWHNNGTMKNFHVPLPDETYADLRNAAHRSKMPATALAREAIDFWLRQQRRKARHDAISAYAAK